MSILTREDLQKLSDKTRQTVVVNIASMGDIKIKPLTTEERLEAREVALTDIDSGEIDIGKYQNYIIIKCLVEPQLEITDLTWLKDFPSGTMDKILAEIYKISDIDLGVVLKKK